MKTAEVKVRGRDKNISVSVHVLPHRASGQYYGSASVIDSRPVMSHHIKPKVEFNNEKRSTKQKEHDT